MKSYIVTIAGDTESWDIETTGTTKADAERHAMTELRLRLMKSVPFTSLPTGLHIVKSRKAVRA